MLFCRKPLPLGSTEITTSTGDSAPEVCGFGENVSLLWPPEDGDCSPSIPPASAFHSRKSMHMSGNDRTYFALSLYQLIVKKPGKTRDNGIRSIGRQLHIIPVADSTMVHNVEDSVP